MMYYVNWVLTSAQLDLIAADVSVVDYSYGRKKDKKRGRKGEFNDAKADKQQLKKAAEEWRERYGEGGQKKGSIKLGDIMGNMEISKGIKL